MSDFREIMQFYREIGVEFLERRPVPERKADPLNAAAGLNKTEISAPTVPSAPPEPDAIPSHKSAAAVASRPPATMEEIIREIRSCKKCKLHETKKNYVPGEGGLTPDILFIGEGPGETEDNFGRPFIGNAGQLLDKMIEKMGYNRETVFICNIVKCRPPGNREPHADEAAACRPFLLQQIRLLQPKVIVCLGRIALNHLTGTVCSIMEKRGQLFDFNGVPMIPTFHPSYILHQKTPEAVREAKWQVWRDMEVVLRLLGKAANPAK